MKSNDFISTVLFKLLEVHTKPNINILESQRTQILMLANSERAKSGIHSLKENSALSRLALIKSQDMVENNYFSHQSPIHGSIFDMMKSNGINYLYAGENLAIQSHADHAHTAWMGSKAHKMNILNASFMEIGIGIAAKSNGSFVYTQLFTG